MLDSNRISIFLKAAECCNFSMTARHFHISQPAVSQNISEIEKYYGIKLFERQKGNIHLSNEGKVFRNYVESINRNYTELNYIFLHFAELEAIKKIRIQAEADSITAVGRVLLPYIYKVCPDIELTLLSGSVHSEDNDLTIMNEGGRCICKASATFSDSVLFRLIKEQDEISNYFIFTESSQRSSDSSK